MNKILILLIIPFLIISQNLDENHIADISSEQMHGCIDLDETLLDVVSVFGDTSLLDGLLGCAELIPTLESGILSAFLPFDIPLDCNTDLTPFGYLDMDMSDVCECSCQDYLNLSNEDFNNKKIRTLDIYGREFKGDGFYFELYKDGTVTKKYKL